MAAIQGLNQKVDEQSAALRERDERIARLEFEVNDLRRLIRQELVAARSPRP